MKNFSEKEYNAVECSPMRDSSTNEIIGQNHDSNGPFAKDSRSENFLHKNLDDTPHGRKIKPAIIALFAVCLYTMCLYIIINNMPETIRAVKESAGFFVVMFIATFVALIRFERSSRRAVTFFFGKRSN